MATPSLYPEGAGNSTSLPDHIRKMGQKRPTGFLAIMRALNRKQVPVCEGNKSFHGSWHLYGHVHGRLVAEDAAHPSWLTKDVGVDACEYRPLSFDDLRIYMAPRFEQFQRWRAAISQGEAESGA